MRTATQTVLPLSARWLGWGGVLPFAAGALGTWLAPLPWVHVWAFALSAYGAVIVSFLGGIHWGMAFRAVDGDIDRPRMLAWGVVPSLIAWAALLLPPGAGLIVLAAALATCRAVDGRIYPRQQAGAWLPLRTGLTVVAGASCLLAAVAMILR